MFRAIREYLWNRKHKKVMAVAVQQEAILDEISDYLIPLIPTLNERINFAKRPVHMLKKHMEQRVIYINGEKHDIPESVSIPTLDTVLSEMALNYFIKEFEIQLMLEDSILVAASKTTTKVYSGASFACGIWLLYLKECGL